jgi:hypothetical protein
MEIDMTQDPAEIRAFAERNTASWCSMDPVTMAAHYAPEGSLAINGGAPAAGRDAITAVAASFYEALPDMQVYFGDLVVDRNRIEYHWTFTGTNTGPAGTGNAVRVKGFESWTIDVDGLIAASIGSYDAEGYGRQLAEGVLGLCTACGRYPP